MWEKCIAAAQTLRVHGDGEASDRLGICLRVPDGWSLPERPASCSKEKNKGPLKNTLHNTWETRSHWKVMGDASLGIIVREQSWERRVRDIIGRIVEILTAAKGVRHAGN